MPTPDTPSTPPPSTDGQPVAHIEFKAMLLLALMMAVVLGSVAYVLYARGIFENTQRLVLLADDSEGVVVGMDLTFSGFPIGRVRRTELAEDGKVRVLVDVATDDARWLRTSSVFTMERGVVGDTKLRAFTGVLTDPPLPPDAERPVLRGDVTAEIPRLIATVQALVENLANMSRDGSSLNATLDNTRALTGKLGGPEGALGVLLGSDANARKAITALDRTNALLARTESLLGRADQRLFGKSGVVDDTQASLAQLTGLLADARASLKKVDAVLVEAQAIGANARVASTDLGVLRAEVEASLRKVDALVQEVNRKWPFARETEIKLP
ncbi:mammalian cell entry protein [Rhodoferax koreense]|uniref:Mammalian cell entry protein n=1 Tax=Rhodoferax koreensis TaxID=1842727 RepID=A0A1P8JQN4_9BURK|nr:MlaD family protein [Rhodoferax koreense]APW36074.1 mammalian cell entry protein [Rhodoferax koreense]